MSNRLTPSFCDDITGLKDFLRLSRTLVDDTITQNLNNLVLPPRFDPTSTLRSEKKSIGNPIDEQSCNTLISTIFENWDARTQTIDYCLRTIGPTTATSHHDLTPQEVRARRLDPYSSRQENEEPILKRVCDQENGTERIIRDRTWRIVRNRCQNLSGMDANWELAFAKWRNDKR